MKQATTTTKSSPMKSCFSTLCVFLCDFIILNINKLIHKMTMGEEGGGRGGLTRRETMYA